MRAHLYYIGNDMVLDLSALTDEAGAYRTDASVAVTLVDADGNNVVGQAWPLAMNYQAGTPATYRAILPAGLSVSARDKIEAKITAVAGGSVGFWQEPITANIRRSKR